MVSCCCVNNSLLVAVVVLFKNADPHLMAGSQPLWFPLGSRYPSSPGFTGGSPWVKGPGLLAVIDDVIQFVVV